MIDDSSRKPGTQCAWQRWTFPLHTRTHRYLLMPYSAGRVVSVHCARLSLESAEA